MIQGDISEPWKYSLVSGLRFSFEDGSVNIDMNGYDTEVLVFQVGLVYINKLIPDNMCSALKSPITRPRFMSAFK